MATIGMYVASLKRKHSVNPSDGDLPIANTTMTTAFKRLTVITISLGIVFLVTNLPVSITTLIYRSMNHDVTTIGVLRVAMAAYIAGTISLLNHCVNMWCYLLFSKRFRKDVIKLFHCKFREVISPSPNAAEIVI